MVQFTNLYILSLQLGLQLTQLDILLLQLLGKALQRTAQLIALDGALAQLVTQLTNQLTVLLHLSLNELYILTNALHRCATLTRFRKGDTLFSLIDGTESLLYVVHRCHHVVYLVVFLFNNTRQGVALLQQSLLDWVISFLFTCHQCQQTRSSYQHFLHSRYLVFGDFAATAHLTLKAEHLAELLQRLQHAIGRLVEYHRALLVLQRQQLCLAAFLLRQETLEAEAVTRQSTRHQCRDKSRSTWQGLHLDAGLHGLTHQEESWIGDAWCARITNQRHRLTSL